MSAINKTSKEFQIVVPQFFREALKVHEDNDVEWILNEKEGNATIIFHKKASLMDIAGICELDEKTDVVDLKHKLQRGQL